VDTYEINEWQECFIPKASLSVRDRLLVEQLGGEAGRVDLDELKDGIRVRARSWIGVLRFESFEIRIRPKLAGNYLNLIDLLAYTTGFTGLRRNIGKRLLQEESTGGLLDLIAQLFVVACGTLVNNGLLYDYITRDGALPVLRGRLLMREQITQRAGRLDLLECRFDEHSTDITENQLLALALSICTRCVKDHQVRLSVNRLAALFDSLCQVDKLNLNDARHLIYHRLNQHYQEAHQLAWLLIDGMGIKDLYAAKELRSFAFLINMDPVFERFVWKLIEYALGGTKLQVYYQKHDRSILWNALANRSYANIIPDLLIQSMDDRQQRFVVEAKYKRYDLRKISPEDIYQNFLYAYAYGGITQPQALLIHPTEGKTTLHTHLQVRTGGISSATIYALGIEIPEALTLAKAKQAYELKQLLFGEIPELYIFASTT